MVNYNGILLEQAQTPIENRGLHYGDAVFETMKYSGGKLFFWEDHYFRLMASMRILRMEIPQTFTPEFLEEQIEKTIVAQQESSSAFRVKLLVWRDTTGNYLPHSNDVSYTIIVSPLDHSFYMLDEATCEVELFKDYYVNSGLLSTLKTNNKIINVVGSIFAKENGYQNCLLLNEKKQVIEALNGNLFLVKDGRVKTPPLEDGCLKGIIRTQILDILNKVPDYLIEESSISPFELQKADELFITNVITGIQPITKYRKKTYTNEVSQHLIGKLNTKARLG